MKMIHSSRCAPIFITRWSRYARLRLHPIQLLTYHSGWQSNVDQIMRSIRIERTGWAASINAGNAYAELGSTWRNP
jgi:hypothetical protein